MSDELAWIFTDPHRRMAIPKNAPYTVPPDESFFGSRYEIFCQGKP